MDELCGAIDENQLHQLILKPEHEVESSIEINGKIVHLQDGKILIEVCNEALVDTDKTYSLHFQLNRNNIELQLNALSFIEKHNLYDCLLDHPAYRLNGKLIDTLKENYDSWFEYWHSALSSDESTLWFECFIEKKETHHYSSPLAALQGTSAEQNKAVKSIVNGSSYPLPYLLTGPAGKRISLYDSQQNDYQHIFHFVRDWQNRDASSRDSTNRRSDRKEYFSLRQVKLRLRRNHRTRTQYFSS